MMIFENDLHDWFLDGIILRENDISLFVHLLDQRKKLMLRGLSRCLFNQIIIQNIIHDVKIFSADIEPERFKEETARLDGTYPSKWVRQGPNILCITPSVGADAIIEFHDFDIVDVP